VCTNLVTSRRQWVPRPGPVRRGNGSRYRELGYRPQQPAPVPHVARGPGVGPTPRFPRLARPHTEVSTPPHTHTVVTTLHEPSIRTASQKSQSQSFSSSLLSLSLQGWRRRGEKISSHGKPEQGRAEDSHWRSGCPRGGVRR
jgi:hypothetical protein